MVEVSDHGEGFDPPARPEPPLTGEELAEGGLGIAIGVAVTFIAAGRLSPLLFDVSPRDPLVYTLVATAMMVVALAASFIPARRAACVDPNVALRSE